MSEMDVKGEMGEIGEIGEMGGIDEIDVLGWAWLGQERELTYWGQ